jgi:transcription elongation factor GreA
MTPQGYEKLKAELERLLRVERPRNIREIEEARAHGDLSENAEYHAAKERQSHIEGRIMELQDKLSRAEVIDPAKLGGSRVAFGARVKVYDLGADEEYVFYLVGPEEADARAGKISISSPVGKALLGKEVGDTVRVQAPARVIEYEVLEISYS